MTIEIKINENGKGNLTLSCFLSFKLKLNQNDIITKVITTCSFVILSSYVILY